MRKGVIIAGAFLVAGTAVVALVRAPSGTAGVAEGPAPVQPALTSADSPAPPPSETPAAPANARRDSTTQPRPASGRAGAGDGTAGSAPAPVTAGMRSTRAGVYSTAQAAKGETLYNQLCNSCHAPLQNHVGAYFRQSWGGSTVGDMMEYLQAEMPKNDPGSLSAAEYADVIAYLLKVNGMPAGDAALAAEVRALKQIRIDTAR